MHTIHTSRPFFLTLSRHTILSIQISLDLAEHLVMILKDNNHRIVLLGVSCLRQISAHLQHISKPLLKYARRVNYSTKACDLSMPIYNVITDYIIC